MTTPLGSLIAVDVGNTQTKFHLFQDSGSDDWPAPRNELQLPTHDIVREFSLEPILATLIDNAADVATIRWFVSSVHPTAERQLAEAVQATRPMDSYHRLSHTDVPLTINVKYPERVGMDRLVAAVAANHLRQPDRGAIVVGAGSAITVNLVSPMGEFQGGAILPGFGMSARVLASDAAALPSVDLAAADELPPVVGKSTDEAIRSGVIYGALGAVRELVARISAQLAEPPELFVTGGDLPRLQTLENARLVPELVAGGVLLSARHIGARNE